MKIFFRVSTSSHFNPLAACGHRLATLCLSDCKWKCSCESFLSLKLSKYSKFDFQLNDATYENVKLAIDLWLKKNSKPIWNLNILKNLPNLVNFIESTFILIQWLHSAGQTRILAASVCETPAKRIKARKFMTRRERLFFFSSPIDYNISNNIWNEEIFTFKN